MQGKSPSILPVLMHFLETNLPCSLLTTPSCLFITLQYLLHNFTLHQFQFTGFGVNVSILNYISRLNKQLEYRVYQMANFEMKMVQYTLQLYRSSNLRIFAISLFHTFLFILSFFFEILLSISFSTHLTNRFFFIIKKELQMATNRAQREIGTT